MEPGVRRLASSETGEALIRELLRIVFSDGMSFSEKEWIIFRTIHRCRWDWVDEDLLVLILMRDCLEDVLHASRTIRRLVLSLLIRNITQMEMSPTLSYKCRQLTKWFEETMTEWDDLEISYRRAINMITEEEDSDEDLPCSATASPSNDRLRY